MSGHRGRINAIQTLLAGTSISVYPGYSDIHDELQEVRRSRYIRNSRQRNLLQVVNSCRAVDTCLSLVLTQDLQVAPSGMGNALNQLRSIGIRRTGRRLSSNLCSTHKIAVSRVRNHYLHSAAAYPANSTEVDGLLNNMHSCLQDVINLI